MRRGFVPKRWSRFAQAGRRRRESGRLRDRFRGCLLVLTANVALGAIYRQFARAHDRAGMISAAWWAKLTMAIEITSLADRLDAQAALDPRRPHLQQSHRAVTHPSAGELSDASHVPTKFSGRYS